MDSNNENNNSYTNYVYNPYGTPRADSGAQPANDPQAVPQNGQQGMQQGNAQAENPAPFIPKEQMTENFESSPWSQPETVAAPEGQAASALNDKYNQYTYTRPQGQPGTYGQMSYSQSRQGNAQAGQNTYAQPQQNYGQAQNAYAQPQGYAQAGQNAYTQSQQNYGQAQNAYAQPQGYAQAGQNAYTQPQQNYGQTQNAYGQPQGYAQAGRNAYTQPQQNYGQTQNAYGQPQGYAQAGQNAYTQPQTGSQNVFYASFDASAPEASQSAKIKGYVAMGLGIAAMIFPIIAIINTYESASRGSYYLWFLGLMGIACGIAAQVLSKACVRENSNRYTGPAKAGKIIGIIGIVFNGITAFIGMSFLLEFLLNL